MAGPSPVTWPSVMDSVQEPSFWSFAKTVGDRLTVIWIPPPEDGDRSMRMSLLMPTKLPPTSVPAWDVGVLPEVVRLRADRSRQRDVGPSSLPSSSISRCVHGMRSRHAVVAPVPVFCSWARVPLSCWCGRRVPRFVRNATGAGAAAPRRRRGAPGYRRQRGSDARLSPSIVDHSDGDSLWQPRRAILTRHVGRPAAGTARWVSASGPVPRAVRTVWTHLPSSAAVPDLHLLRFLAFAVRSRSERRVRSGGGRRCAGGGRGLVRLCRGSASMSAMMP